MRAKVEKEHAAREAAVTQIIASAPSGGLLNGKRSSMPSVTSDGSDLVTIHAIQLEGLGVPDDEFLAKLPPLHVNDRVSRRALSDFVEAVRKVDEHLSFAVMPSPDGPNSITVRISAPSAFGGPRITADVANTAPAFPGAIPVGGRVQNNKLISKTDPVYPDMAKSARISGTVELKALIGPDGHMQQLSVISGHPLLRQAALDAVKNWVYEPTLLNGSPVSVSTTIDVIFTLSQ